MNSSSSRAKPRDLSITLRSSRDDIRALAEALRRRCFEISRLKSAPTLCHPEPSRGISKKISPQGRNDKLFAPWRLGEKIKISAPLRLCEKFIAALLATFISVTSFAEPLETRALLVPASHAKLSSQLSGQVKQITVETGDKINSGQLLMAFKCQVEKAQLRKSEAELKSAQHRLDSNRKLRALGSSSDLEIALSEAEVEKFEADIAHHQAIIRKCSIFSPFSGRVVKREVQPYESVTTGQALLEIIDDHSLNVDLLVPSSWLSWLEKGQKFTVNIAETQKSYSASVTRINGQIDSVSQTIEVFGKLDGRPKELLAGMSGIALFEK